MNSQRLIDTVTCAPNGNYAETLSAVGTLMGKVKPHETLVITVYAWDEREDVPVQT